MEPQAVAYRGVGHLGDLTGKSVFLAGTGTIGLLVLVCAKIKGAGTIFVSDMDDERLKVAKSLGADIVINPAKEIRRKRSLHIRTAWVLTAVLRL